MKLIVVDSDRLKFLSVSHRKQVNEVKICSLLSRDFGKKILLNVPKNNPEYLDAYRQYTDSIFRIKDVDECLRHEDKLFRRIHKHIKYFRVGVLLRRDKACKILLKLLGK